MMPHIMISSRTEMINATPIAFMAYKSHKSRKREMERNLLE